MSLSAFENIGLSYFGSYSWWLIMEVVFLKDWFIKVSKICELRLTPKFATLSGDMDVLYLIFDCLDAA